MKYHQGDIVEVNFLFPNGVQKPHPALIVSNDELYENEEFFYLCLISSKDYNPQYSFAIANDMVSIPFDKPSYVKCQLCKFAREGVPDSHSKVYQYQRERKGIIFS